MVLCSRCEREKVYTLFTVNNKNKKVVQKRKKMGFTMGNRKDIYLQCRGEIWHLQWEYGFLQRNG